LDIEGERGKRNLEITECYVRKVRETFFLNKKYLIIIITITDIKKINGKNR